MKKTILLTSMSLIMVFMFCFSGLLHAQTEMPLPSHSNVYTGYTRGYWFVAPMDFTISGLKVAPEAGSGMQYIHVMKCNDQFPVLFTAQSNNFVTLNYTSGAPNNTIVPVNIQVQQGDQIGILATVSGNGNSYAANQVTTSTIGTHQVYLNRFGHQGYVANGQAISYWGVANGGSDQIGRVFMYYTLAGPTDAGLETFVFPADTICEGNSAVQVALKNHGPDPLIDVDIHWSVNNIAQTPYSWSGNLAVNQIDTAVVGAYPFAFASTYDITAYTCTPNFNPDTINNLNDTIDLSGISVKPAPQFTPSAANFYSCSGDSVYISGTLSGVPPWSVFVEYGPNAFSIDNITSSAFGFYVTPNTNTVYSIVKITDASECPNNDTLDISVEVVPSPTAHVNVMAPPVGCEGDVVPMQVTTDPSYACQWYRNGVLLTGETNTVYNSTTSGGYRVKVTDTVGCSTMSQLINITLHPAPNVFIGNDTNIAPGQSLMLDAGAGFTSYKWSNGSTSQSITIDSSGVGLGTKTVWVRVTDNKNCPGTDTIRVTFVHNPGIIEAGLISGIKIYPNPNEGTFVLQLPETLMDKNRDIEFLNTEGRLMKTMTIKSGENIHPVDLSVLQSGIYYLRIKGIPGLYKVVLMR